MYLIIFILLTEIFFRQWLINFKSVNIFKKTPSQMPMIVMNESLDDFNKTI